MRLSTKFTLALLPIVLAAILGLGWWQQQRAEANLQQTYQLWLETILDAYVNGEVGHRYQILEQTGLADMPSYRQRYQQEAMQAAAGIAQRHDGNFFWFDAEQRLLFATDELLAEKFADRFRQALPQHGAGQGLAHVHLGAEDGKSGLLVVRQDFSPWGVQILFAVSDQKLHGRLVDLELGTLGVAALFLFASFLVISWLTRRYLQAPIVRLRDAADQIADRNFVEQIAVASNDELGQLARHLEGMSGALKDYQQDRDSWYANLEELVQQRTQELRAAQHHLEDALELNNAIVKGAQAGIMAYRKNGQCILANQAAGEIIGATQEQMLAQNFRSIDSWKKSGLLDVSLATLQDGKVRSLEVHLLTSFGKDVWLDCAVQRFQSSDETHLLLTYSDITGFRHSEQQLLLSSERLQQALDAAQAGTFFFDLKEKRLQWDKRSMAIYGVDPERFVPSYQAWQQLVDPEDLPRVETSFLNAIASNSQKGFEIEYRVPQADGSLRFVNAQAQIHRDEEGGPVSIAGLHLDVTRQREIARELEEGRERLAEALDAARAGIFEFYPTSGRMVWDRRSRQLFAVADDFQPDFERWTNLIEPADLPRVKAEITAIFADPHGDLFDLEYRLKRNQRVIRVLSRVYRDAGGAVNKVQGLHLDVSEQRQVEAELQRAKVAAEAANRAKSDFLANMSHEIRTPMNAVTGTLYLLNQTQLDERQQNYLHKIELSTKSLLRILNDILDFSKVEAGKLELEQASFSLAELFEHLGTVMTGLAKEKRLELLYRVSAETPLWLVGDSLRLGQVLINLVGNAIKFTERGEIIVGLQSRDAGAGMLEVEFSVTDSGIGIQAEKLAHIFDLFSQEDTSTTRRYGGTGLGLAISQRLVRMMGGEISATSQPGQGSRFAFCLRLPLAEPPAEKLPRSDAELATLKVLVVDDNTAAREVLTEMVGSFGCQVTAAAAGRQGLQLLQQAEAAGTSFDLLLLDWRMPEMSGGQVIEQLQSWPESAQQPKVVIVSAYDDENVLAESRRLGVAGFLVKPIFPALLENCLRRIGRGEPLAPQVVPGLQAEKLSLQGRKILLVEDNPLNQQVIGELLRGMGSEVEIAGDGSQAVAMIKDSGDYDLVLLDLQMPVMDGYEASRQIREIPEFSQLPIIAMTANVLPEVQGHCLAAGMDDYLGKPVDVAELCAVLSRWLEEELVAAAASAQTPALNLPDALPGLNLALALQRLAGNQVLLSKLLRGFRAAHLETEQQLAGLLAAGDSQGATQLLHSLKGVAGNVGAEELRQLAAQLETQLKEHPQQVEQGVRDKFSAALATSLTSIAQLPLPQAEKAPARTVDPLALQQPLSELQELLQEKNLAALDCLEQLKPLLAGSELKRRLAELNQAMERLDFNRASTLLQELAAEAGVMLEEKVRDDGN